jgi:hypothetical protein
MDVVVFFELEYRATQERYVRRQGRLQAQEGFGSTDDGMAIINRFFDALLASYDHGIEMARGNQGPVSGLVPNRLKLDRRLLALCVLQTTLHTLGDGVSFGKTVMALGQAMEAECFRQGLTKANKQLAANVAERLRNVNGDTVQKRARST